ncbi:STE3-domain-containing protein [Thelephora ganbajun]|uniref:STE3-domain-containing protein n=1 Tax=Thelephora ganbajun TaxID=370292 RepID=A0ACB6ZP06_THEGA|nr:STE3-domain-containing protein [Thelephora ganbajun]
MNTTIWCDISTKLMVGAYIGVPASIICVLHRLYMTASAPDSLPDKRLYQFLCKLTLVLGMPALIVVIRIVVQDRRYIFIEQAGCIPSISLSLFPLVAVLIWPLLFNVASLAYLGLVIHLIWAPRRNEGVALMSPETMTFCHFLRLSVSTFLGIVCTSSISLFLLLWIINDSNISVNSLHHDFQTVYIITTDRWSRNPQLRTAVKLRWLWASMSFALTIGLFPKERADRLLGWLASAKVYARTRVWHRSTLNAICHGSLPVYISRSSSSSSYGEAPAIPSLVRQSTLAPTFSSRVSSVQFHQPEVSLHTSERDARSNLSQPYETIRPNEPSELQETSQPSELPQLGESS